MAHYLRIGELARRTGVSPALLRAWEHRYGLLEPTRSTGGFRLYSDADVWRVRRAKALMNEGISAAEAAARVLTAEPSGDVGASGTSTTDLIERLSSALDALDEASAHAVIDETFSIFSIEAGLRDVILPYLATVGERWAAGHISVGQEHFASNLIRGRMLGLAHGWGSGIGRTLLLACPPGEEHELGLMAFGIVAARRGWRVVYLGPDTPFDTIEVTAREVRPTWIVLSVSTPEHLTRQSDALSSLARVARVAVGGVVDAADLRTLDVRVLDQDPVSAAHAITTEAPRT